MKRFLIIAALPLLLLLAACQREAGPEPLPEGSVVKAEFENPAGGAPLTLERKIFPSLPRVVLESPDVTCVKKERPYRVVIALHGPGGERLQILETQVTSSLDQDILPEKALIVGPGYDKNPEVFKDGKAPAHFETAKCRV